MMRFFNLVVFVLFLAVPMSGFAQEADQPDEMDCSIPKELKDPLKAPPEIKIGIFFVDVQTINDKGQTFLCNVIYQATWQDPRLSERSLGRSLENCTIAIDDIWHPDIVPMNYISGDTYRNKITVDKQGKVKKTSRVRNGQFFFDLEYEEFPFDTQVLHINFGTADEITLAFDRESTGIRNKLSIDGWDIALEDAVLTSEQIESHKSIARLDFQLSAKRHPGYYLWKIIFPLCLIVLMAWSVFWIDPTQLGPQLGLSTATVFTLIAFRFTLGFFTPHVSYFSRLDYFVLLCTFLVFIALGLAITTSKIAVKNKELAVKIERTSRIVYLVIFAFIIIYSFLL